MSAPFSECDIAIIGGGISGLATAFELRRLGVRAVVLERQSRPGGNAISERLAKRFGGGGFLMEHGPSTVSALSETANQFSGLLGLDSVRHPLGAAVRKRYLVAGGRLKGIATHPLGFLTSSYLSPKARFRLLAEILMPHRPQGRDACDETVAAFFCRRFGSEFAERVIDPLVAGIYSGRASALSMHAVFPKLVALEAAHGSVIAGLLKRRSKREKMPGSRLFSWTHGVGTLPAALARRLGTSVRTSTPIRRIRRHGSGFEVDMGKAGRLTARAIVIATQPHIAALMLERLDTRAAEAAAEIKAPPLAVVFLGFRREAVAHPLDGLGFLTARGEGRTLTGAQFCSTMFPGRAPEGFVAVTGYFGGVRAPDTARLSAPDLTALARQEFADLIGAKGPPLIARVRHWPLGLPQYAPGHDARRTLLETTSERCPGLHVTGNYFSGPSVAACLEQARHTARRAARSLKAPRFAAPSIMQSSKEAACG